MPVDPLSFARRVLSRPLRPTWDILPSEADKKPSVVTVRNARCRVIAVIDPVTRQRRSRAGVLEAVLSPQGWDLGGKEMRKISFKHVDHGARVPSYERRARNGRVRDADPRIGSGRGPRRARSA